MGRGHGPLRDSDRGVGSRAAQLLLLLLLLLPASPQAARKTPAIAFDGVFVRDQDPNTMEKGLLRTELETLRGFRSRSSMWVIVAPSRAAWDRDVSPGLTEALTKSPAQFDLFAKFLPGTIGRAGPDIEGAVLHLELPDGRGKGIIALALPPLINEGRAGAALMNSPAPNQGRFISGVDIARASDGAEALVSELYLPAWPGALGRGGPPKVPMRELPDDGKGSFALFDGSEGDGQASLMWDFVTAKAVPLEPMDTFPRRLGGLHEMLRSVREDVPTLQTPEGDLSTLAQAPANWVIEQTGTRHPSRYVALSAPVAVTLDGAEHSVIVGIVAFYVPVVLSLSEAPLYLGVEAASFAAAVHRGELPFLASGQDLWFLRGHLDRWKAGEARDGSGKSETLAEAAETARGWGDRYKLRGLARASQGSLPQRFEPIPDKERTDLVDERLTARARVDREDLAAWLKHFEPSLKPGKRAPAWSLAFASGGAELPVAFSLEAPYEPPAAVTSTSGSSPYGDLGGGRGPSSGGAGGGAATATLEAEDDAPVLSAWSGDIALSILDMYATEAVCRTGSRSGAALAFDLAGVPQGSTSKLRIEWDLLRQGRSLSRDAWNIERASGSHEVEFEIPCPDEAGGAELYLALLVPGTDELACETEIPLDVRTPGGRSWPALSMPEPKACAAVAGGEGDADADGFSMGGSVGLTADQIQSSARGFQRQTLRCQEGKTVSGTVQVEVVVGCDGRVSATDVLVDGTGDADFADCVARTFAYAPFPAHDMPDGVTFGLPLSYQ